MSEEKEYRLLSAEEFAKRCFDTFKDFGQNSSDAGYVTIPENNLELDDIIEIQTKDLRE